MRPGPVVRIPEQLHAERRQLQRTWLGQRWRSLAALAVCLVVLLALYALSLLAHRQSNFAEGPILHSALRRFLLAWKESQLPGHIQTLLALLYTAGVCVLAADRARALAPHHNWLAVMPPERLWRQVASRSSADIYVVVLASSLLLNVAQYFLLMAAFPAHLAGRMLLENLWSLTLPLAGSLVLAEAAVTIHFTAQPRLLLNTCLSLSACIVPFGVRWLDRAALQWLFYPPGRSPGGFPFWGQHALCTLAIVALLTLALRLARPRGIQGLPRLLRA